MATTVTQIPSDHYHNSPLTTINVHIILQLSVSHLVYLVPGLERTVDIKPCSNDIKLLLPHVSGLTQHNMLMYRG